ncbi:MAG: CmcJ/NvfI family oxidoreductase, partial [Myxococcota bacterium]
VDYTEASGPKRARDVLGEEAVEAALRHGRAIVQVNAWRPIEGPVLRSPLALGDASSLRTEDLLATDQLFPDRVGEIYHLAYHPDQRFAFFPRMTRDEVVLLKGWDSRTDGRARLTPHSAFALPDEAGAPPRKSVEVRTFAVL